ncbi:MAG: adventurous gliding motility lipoprotein CglB [Archangium sp.]|nr:adventurous gliding motility lipoprotein CglB [Archangium sp.]
MMRSVALLSVLILAGSCQTYDFERVIPLAVAQTTDKTIVASKRLKPNVMLLVDNSGSMLFPSDASDPDCMVGATLCGSAGVACPPGCPTRVSELKTAMATFLQTSGSIARLGLTIFPAPNGNANGVFGCDPSSSFEQQFPVPTPTDDGTDSTLTSSAQSINARIQSLSPNGGTPTGGSLDFLGGYGGLTDAADFRDDFVLLLTDGLPNCNGVNANNRCSCGMSCTVSQAAPCACTTGSCVGTDPLRSTCSKGCLDQDGSVQAVKSLRQRGIRTIVVGFGADTAAGSGPMVLNGMALEGGFGRECPNMTDAECGGAAGSCNRATKQCSTAFFQAANGTELAAALRKISESFQGDPCEFTLSARPSDPRYLSVVINGTSVAASSTTYSYDSNANKVTFLGPLCTQLNTSTTQNPVNVEFRIVERF